MTEQEFISTNSNCDPSALRLKYHGKEMGFDIENVIVQIEARKKCRHKLTNILKHDEFKFPSVLAAEQATDETVARFHACLCKDAISVIDMTAGLGIDALTLALDNPQCHIDAFELDEKRAECLEHNIRTLNLDSQIRVFNEDSCEYLRTSDKHYDILFADPARRAKDNARLYALSDCTPDLTKLMNLINKVSDRFIFKVSPMLDITQLTREIPGIETIYAISLKGELKELLVVGKKDGQLKSLQAVIIYTHDNEPDIFEVSPEAAHLQAPCITDTAFVKEGMFLYEPDSSVMKLGCHGALCTRFPGLLKASANTALFISEWEYLCFPGRVTKIKTVMNKHDLKKLKGENVNIVVRNYPLSAEELKKKIAAKDGGDEFLYALKIASKPMLLKSVRT